MAKVSKRSKAKALIMMFSSISCKANTSDSKNLLRSKHVYIKNLNIEAKRSKFILNFEPSEAKRTCSTVKTFISDQSEHVYIKEFKYRSEVNTFNSLEIYFETKRTCLY